MEAWIGFEPMNNDFADHSLRPLGHHALFNERSPMSGSHYYNPFKKLFYSKFKKKRFFFEFVLILRSIPAFNSSV